MKFNELGRSMVEMLGVLAIIGVLSVGALSGYNKAMMKYKLNEHAYQISQLINTIHLYQYQFQFDVKDSRLSLIPYLQKLNVIPDGMDVVEGDSNLSSYLKDAMGTYSGIYINKDPYNGEIMLVIYGSPRWNYPITFQDTSVGIEYCKNILTVLQSIYRENPGDFNYIYLWNDGSHIIQVMLPKYNFPNMNVSEIANVCEQQLRLTDKKQAFFHISFRKYPS